MFMDKKTIDFIEKAKAVHGTKYDYSKVEYVKATEKVCIICHEHGEFWQTHNNHLRGKGCTSCNGNKKLTKEEFISKARQIHDNKYDYSKVNYVNNSTKVCIICPEHGEFWQSPCHHLQGDNCPKCSHQSYCDTKESFIKKAQKIHGDRYDYSKVKYINAHTKVCISCPIHGDFWAIPTNHISGKGCPICKESKYERLIREALKKEKINFIIKKHFDWLGSQHLDFYLPEYNIAIECQGSQHFYEDKTSMFYGTLKTNVERDNKKNHLCEKNGIKLIYYIEPTILKKALNCLPSIYNENYYTSKEELLKEIKNA